MIVVRANDFNDRKPWGVLPKVSKACTPEPPWESLETLRNGSKGCQNRIDSSKRSNHDKIADRHESSPHPLEPSDSAALRSSTAHFCASDNGSTVLGLTFGYSDDIHITKSSEQISPLRENSSCTLSLVNGEQLSRVMQTTTAIQNYCTRQFSHHGARNETSAVSSVF